jgi:hypothetical protein
MAPKSYSLKRIAEEKLGGSGTWEEQLKLAAKVANDPEWFHREVLGDKPDEYPWLSADVQFIRDNGGAQRPQLAPEPIQLVYHWSAFKLRISDEGVLRARMNYGLLIRWACNVRIANFPLLILDPLSFLIFKEISYWMGGADLLREIMRVRIYADLMGAPPKPKPKDIKMMWEKSKTLVPGSLNALDNSFPILADSEEHKLLDWFIKNKALIINCWTRVGDHTVFPLVPMELRLTDDNFTIQRMHFLTR